MSNPNVDRMAQRSQPQNELRLEPFPNVPSGIYRSFPMMQQWDNEIQSVTRRNSESIRKALGAVADSVGGEGSDYTAAFEAAL